MAPSNSDSSVQPGRLADFLQSQKEAFIADLKKGDASSWHVVMGNEAGDLDTIASSVSFAFLSSTLNATRSVPLVLTPKSLMKLRPENIIALSKASIPSGRLMHPEDLPVSEDKLSSLGVRFCLVDHNRLLPQFGSVDNVDAIVDHHEDEGCSPKAQPRLIQVPTGSCSSLVTHYFKPTWQASMGSGAGAAGSPVPPEVATLLLSASTIDTQGFKKGGKAVDVDRESAAFLYPISTLGAGDANSPAVQAFTATDITGGEAPIPSTLETYTSQLIDTKYNVTGMPTEDLLQRDYKQYSWVTADGSPLELGLSTVPMSMTGQLSAEATGWESYMAHVDDFMQTRGLDVEGVLTSFHTVKAGGKRKGRREILLVVRPGLNLKDGALGAARVLAALGAGLEADSDQFDIEKWGKKTHKGGEGDGKAEVKEKLMAQAPKWLDDGKTGRTAMVWDQGNHRSTRKQVAPALHAVVSKL